MGCGASSAASVREAAERPTEMGTDSVASDGLLAQQYRVGMKIGHGESGRHPLTPREIFAEFFSRVLGDGRASKGSLMVRPAPARCGRQTPHTRTLLPQFGVFVAPSPDATLFAGTFGSCSKAVRKSDGLEVAIKSISKSNRRFKVETVLHEAKVRIRGPPKHEDAHCFPPHILKVAPCSSTLEILKKICYTLTALGPARYAQMLQLANHPSCLTFYDLIEDEKAYHLVTSL